MKWKKKNKIEYIQIRVLDEYAINVIDDFLANVMTFEIHLRYFMLLSSRMSLNWLLFAFAASSV